MEVEDVDRLVHRRRPLWPLALLTALLGAAGVAAWLWVPLEPPAWRVAVFAPPTYEAYEGEVLGAFEGAFERVELDERPADLSRAIAMAEGARALHVVELGLEVVEERPGEGLDRAFVHLRASARVAVSDGSGPTQAIEPIEVAAFGANPEEARIEALEHAAPAIADRVHEALLSRPQVRAFVEDTDVRAELLTRRGLLEDQLERLELAGGARERWDRSCAEATRALAEGSGAPAARCLSDGCAEEYAFAVLPDGSAALVHTETPRMSVGLGAGGAVPRRVEAVERIALVPLDGSERRVIATSSNYYSYPAMSPDGGTVVAVEDWGNGFGLVSIDVASGARTLLRSFSGYPQSPGISADRAWVLLRHRQRRRESPQLVVMPLAPGGAVARLRVAELAEWVHVRTAAEGATRIGIAERVLLDELVPEDAPRDDERREGEDEGELARLFMLERLALLGPDGEVFAWLDDDRHRVRRVVGSHAGEVVLTWDNRQRCGVAWWRPWDAEAPLRVVETEVCVDQPEVAPDGAVVGVARVGREDDLSPGDPEVVRVDPGTGALRILSATSLRERYPRPARQATAIVFDRVGERRYERFPRVATCWLDTAPE